MRAARDPYLASNTLTRSANCKIELSSQTIYRAAKYKVELYWAFNVIRSFHSINRHVCFTRHRPITAPRHKNYDYIPPRFSFCFLSRDSHIFYQAQLLSTYIQIKYCAQGFFCPVSPPAANRFSPALDIIVSLYFDWGDTYLPPITPVGKYSQHCFFLKLFVIKTDRLKTDFCLPPPWWPTMTWKHG